MMHLVRGMAEVTEGWSILARREAEKRCAHIKDPEKRRICIEREYRRVFRW